jgi:hypothetical protein
MAWSAEQQSRLNKEWEVIQRYFPHFQFAYAGIQLCLEGQLTTNRKAVYHVRLYVPNDFPNSVPEVVVTWPNPLTDFQGLSLARYQYSAQMHLLSPKDGFPRICTYKSTHWNPNRTFYNVLIKVRLWLEALDAHKSTGQSLDTYLPEQL